MYFELASEYWCCFSCLLCPHFISLKLNLIKLIEKYHYFQTVTNNAIAIFKFTESNVTTLTELAAKCVASSIPFELVEHVFPPVPEQLQLRIAYWSFPDNEEDIRLYSCLANGSSDEFHRGDQLYRNRSVKEPLQIGMIQRCIAHLTHILCTRLITQWEIFNFWYIFVSPRKLIQDSIYRRRWMDCSLVLNSM